MPDLQPPARVRVEVAPGGWTVIHANGLRVWEPIGQLRAARDQLAAGIDAERATLASLDADIATAETAAAERAM